jgi:hypothetical protein
LYILVSGYSESEGVWLWDWEFQVGFGIHELCWRERHGDNEKYVLLVSKITSESWDGLVWWILHRKCFCFFKKLIRGEDGQFLK